MSKIPSVVVTDSWESENQPVAHYEKISIELSHILTKEQQEDAIEWMIQHWGFQGLMDIVEGLSGISNSQKLILTKIITKAGNGTGPKIYFVCKVLSTLRQIASMYRGFENCEDINFFPNFKFEM